MGDSELIVRARSFALVAHGGQRYGDLPYSAHLDAVAAILEPYGTDAQVIGYLHDVVEDTSVTLDQIRADFGDRVARCVALVTDEPGPDRPARKSVTHDKLSRVAGDDLALIVKAADRLANVRVSAVDPASCHRLTYQREHPAFRQAAYRAGLCDELWAEIEAILIEKPARDAPGAR